MKLRSLPRTLLLPLLGAMVLAVAGCGQGDSASGQAKEKASQGKTEAAQAKQEQAKKHDHSGWWCDEHGVPEGECSQCSAKAAADFKKKGDWCEKHERAKSQCFLCDPKLKEKYAALYRAKVGKEPPPTEDEEKANKDDKK